MVLERREEGECGEVKCGRGVGGTGMKVRNGVAPLVLRPSRFGGLDTSRCTAL